MAKKHLMKYITLFSFLLISTLMISAKGGCSSDSDQQAVIGEWTWVKTFCCGRTSVWSSPESCYCTQSLSIKKDGTYELLKNDKVEKQGKYILRKGLNEFQNQQGDSALVIQMDEDYPAYIEFIGDTLLLARGYMDFDNVYYVKKK